MLSDLYILLWTLCKILVVVLPLMLTVAYLTLAERRIIGFMQGRLGPNRVGPYGLLQPFADVLKLLLKEIIIPSQANKYLFVIAPVLAIAPAIAAWALIPFGDGLVLANINVGLLLLLALTSLAIYGVIIAGWASNSRYAFLGALRASAQMISYELAMSFALVGVVMAAKSLNLSEIVTAQHGGFWHWYWLPLFPLMIIYWISAVAETNRAPFDVVEGESEIIGFHVEYSGMVFALFFMAEYANMILVATLVVLLFFGGWLSPFEGTILAPLFAFVPQTFWLLLKVSVFLFLFLWFRATFPRYRYDQIMRLGWKIFIPITLVWIFIEATFIFFNLGPWFKKAALCNF